MNKKSPQQTLHSHIEETIHPVSNQRLSSIRIALYLTDTRKGFVTLYSEYAPLSLKKKGTSTDTRAGRAGTGPGAGSASRTTG